MEIEEKAKLLGKYEIGWWKGHHRKDIAGARENMVNEYVLQYGIDAGIAGRAVDLRIKAALAHDKAEAYEDKGNSQEAGKYWKDAESFLVEHFKILLGG